MATHFPTALTAALISLPPALCALAVATRIVTQELSFLNQSCEL